MILPQVKQSCKGAGAEAKVQMLRYRGAATEMQEQIRSSKAVGLYKRRGCRDKECAESEVHIFR